MEDKPTTRGGGIAVMVLVAVLIILPMLYVLSIGPVVWLVSNGAISPAFMPAIEAVYFPLVWAANNNVPLIGPALEKYAELWRTAPPVAVPSTTPVPAPSGS